MSSHTIGIDIGTTGTKTILFDANAGIVAQATRDATLISLKPGYAEADPAQWHANVTDSIRQLLAQESTPLSAGSDTDRARNERDAP